MFAAVARIASCRRRARGARLTSRVGCAGAGALPMPADAAAGATAAVAAAAGCRPPAARPTPPLPPRARCRRCRAAAADAAAGCLPRSRACSLSTFGLAALLCSFSSWLIAPPGTNDKQVTRRGGEATNKQTNPKVCGDPCVRGWARVRPFQGGNNCGVLAHGDPLHGRARSAARRRHRCESFGRLIPSTPTSVTDHTGHRHRQGHCHRPVMAARLHIEHDRRSRADGWRAASQPAHGPIRRGQWAVQRGRVA